MIATQEQIGVHPVIAGLDRLQEWLEAHPDAVLVAVGVSPTGTPRIHLDSIAEMSKHLAGTEAHKQQSGSSIHCRATVDGIEFVALDEVQEDLGKVTL